MREVAGSRFTIVTIRWYMYLRRPSAPELTAQDGVVTNYSKLTCPLVTNTTGLMEQNLRSLTYCVDLRGVY